MIYVYIIFFKFLLKSHAIDTNFDDLVKKTFANNKKYDQVPKNVLIFARYASVEPLYFSSGPFKGHGPTEYKLNFMIQKLREQGIEVYVDYFTPAKASIFYEKQEGYEICRPVSRFYEYYINFLNKLKRNFNQEDGKFKIHSLPYMIESTQAMLLIRKEDLTKYEKHLFKNSYFYNIKSILDDESLKTIQITGMSSRIRDFIYEKYDANILKKKYKFRVYDFVASDGMQIPLMLRGFRMDWVDSSISRDYNMNIVNIDSLEKIENCKNKPNCNPGFTSQLMPIFALSQAPGIISNDNINLATIRCSGNNLKKLKKIMKVINTEIKRQRQDKKIIEKIHRAASLKRNVPYESLEKDPYAIDYLKNFKKLKDGEYDGIVSSD